MNVRAEELIPSISITRYFENHTSNVELAGFLIKTPSLDVGRFAHARETIAGWDGYAPTSLHELAGLADKLGIKKLYYKDESERFSLGSFKALGGAYAVSVLTETDRPEARNITVTCATDGNHGRSVAWGAHKAGIRCVVFLHEGVSQERAAAIRRWGAEVCWVSGNYDDSVRAAAEAARENGWIVVSDTSYQGYTDIPAVVMVGYSILIDEILEQIGRDIAFSHVFIQGGVGGLAASVAAYLWHLMGESRPEIIVVESDQCDCLLKSAENGRLTAVTGSLDTIIAGLACGEPSLVAWDVLQHAANAFISIPDEAAARTMRLLAFPVDGDPPIVAGESGAAGLAGLIAATNSADIRKQLGLDSSSQVLVIGTEGATDPGLYREIVGVGNETISANNPGCGFLSENTESV